MGKEKLAMSWLDKLAEASVAQIQGAIDSARSPGPASGFQPSQQQIQSAISGINQTRPRPTPKATAQAPAPWTQKTPAFNPAMPR